MPIEVSYKYSVKGAEDVKKRMQELNEQYEKGDVTVQQYGKSLRDIDRDAKGLNRTQNISKNLFLATHPTVNKLSKGLSNFSSVMRTSLSIMNAINLSNLANNSISSQRIAADSAVTQAQRELAIAIKKYGADSIEAAEAQDKLNVAIAEQQELMTKEKQQGINDFITTVSGIGTAIATSLSLIVNNPTLSKTIWSTASKLGGLFGGIFTGMSSMIMAAGQWVTSALGIGSGVYAKSATAGMQSGTAYGLSFVGGIVAGITAAAGAVAVLDILEEKLFGTSPVKDIQKRLGVENPQSVLDSLGMSPTTPPFFDPLQRKTTDAQGNLVRNKSSGAAGLQEDINNQLKIFKPLIDLFSFQLPEAYGETDQKFNEVFSNNIPTALTTAATTTKEGFRNMWNGIINLTNAAGSSMVSASNSIFQSLISSLNSMINAYNTAAKKIGKSTVSRVEFSPVAYTSLPLIAAENGFNGIVNNPTMFLTGENNKPEHVAVTPLGKNSGGSGVTIIQHVHVSGSIIAERELSRIQDKYLKDSLIKAGLRKPITN